MAEVKPLVARLDKRYKTLQSQRSNWESHWQELADFMLPRKADITKKRTQGDKRTERIFDGTAIHAVELLASSLHGMLTSPSTPWFSMRYRDTALQRDDSANEWLEICMDRCTSISIGLTFSKRSTSCLMIWLFSARGLFTLSLRAMACVLRVATLPRFA